MTEQAKGAERLPQQALALGPYQDRVENRLVTWKDANFARRLWAKDYTLWADQPDEITNRLGWLHLPETMRDQAAEFQLFAERIRSEGIRHVVLLGMGGSSLAPQVFQRTFGNARGYPKLSLLDSTHPDAVRHLSESIDIHKTFFLVSSKSGTTLETLSLLRYFWSKSRENGSRFAAITDPNTPLERLAKERGFRHVFRATPDVGGRYSALTAFGLVPAALIGLDLPFLLDRARRMSETSAFGVAEKDNPSLTLGAALGELALAERDKVTFFTTRSLGVFPIWLEQLIAESTGKSGKGIIPVADEPPGPPEIYGKDRCFVQFQLTDETNELGSSMAALWAAGHPVVRIRLQDKFDLGQEIFRWEIAVAGAGAILGIHPFNQPDVELAKELARQAMSGGASSASVDEEVVETTRKAKLSPALSGWLAQVRPGDYIAIQAYVAPSPDIENAVREIRVMLRDRFKIATTFGYGPRFLHSTGQLHKGGPNTVLALQLLDEPAEDLAVPETGYTFKALIHAQALGDYRALKERQRRVLRVNLGTDPLRGMEWLKNLI